MSNPNIYTVGGTVQAGGGIYISRQADEELLALCRQRIFAYVLTPRQMGKSSLMVRTAERLTEEDIKWVIIDTGGSKKICQFIRQNDNNYNNEENFDKLKGL